MAQREFEPWSLWHRHWMLSTVLRGAHLLFSEYARLLSTLSCRLETLGPILEQWRPTLPQHLAQASFSPWKTSNPLHTGSGDFLGSQNTLNFSPSWTMLNCILIPSLSLSCPSKWALLALNVQGFRPYMRRREWFVQRHTWPGALRFRDNGLSTVPASQRHPFWSIMSETSLSMCKHVTPARDRKGSSRPTHSYFLLFPWSLCLQTGLQVHREPSNKTSNHTAHDQRRWNQSHGFWNSSRALYLKQHIGCCVTMPTEGRKTALRCFCPNSGAHKCVRSWQETVRLQMELKQKAVDLKRGRLSGGLMSL